MENTTYELEITTSDRPKHVILTPKFHGKSFETFIIKAEDVEFWIKDYINYMNLNKFTFGIVRRDLA